MFKCKLYLELSVETWENTTSESGIVAVTARPVDSEMWNSIVLLRRSSASTIKAQGMLENTRHRKL